MQIVIDIPEKCYNDIRNSKTANNYSVLSVLDGIRNGTILPKGHGRLFDERDIVYGSYEIIGNKIYELDPIIEADIS